MTHGEAERVEILVDAGAAMLLAGAVGYAAMNLTANFGLDLAITTLTFLAGFYGLRRIAPHEPAFALPVMACVPAHEADADVLELTEADHWRPEAVDTGELLLDTELAHFGPGSRVVRLFEPSSMPTAGELKARIDRHLVQSPQQPAPPDASQELYDALAELRRSLR